MTLDKDDKNAIGMILGCMTLLVLLSSLLSSDITHSNNDLEVQREAEAKGREAAKLWGQLLGPEYVGVTCATTGPPHSIVTCDLKRVKEHAPILLECHVASQHCKPVLPDAPL